MKNKSILPDISQGPFAPTWESLDEKYVVPQWFRNAKFGIWAHWGPQSVGESGDWYAKYMYHPKPCTWTYPFYHNMKHMQRFGHPSKFGYKDILPLFTAENWDPEYLMKKYVAAGAKYFVAMGCHHDNFDCFDSTYQQWNSVNIGPKKDIVGIWKKEAEKHNLYFGASHHADYALWWWQSAFCSDNVGEYKGVPYDAARQLDGKGTWWEGYDLKEFYGIDLSNECTVEGDRRDDFWCGVPERLRRPENIRFAQKYMLKWYKRVAEMTDKYDLDLLYFDGGEKDSYPFSGTGTGRGIASDATPRLLANLYNLSVKKHGENRAIGNIKTRKGNAVVLDFESKFDDEIKPYVWQHDVTIGEWFYCPEMVYKTENVIYQLLEVISRNGNLLLNVPLNYKGELDPGGEKFLDEMAKWMRINGEGVYDTRPWIRCKEGDLVMPKGNLRGEIPLFTEKDIRFTSKGNCVYAFVLCIPQKDIVIKSMKSFAGGDTAWGKRIGKISLLGYDGEMHFLQNGEGLHISYPKDAKTLYTACFKIEILESGR